MAPFMIDGTKVVEHELRAVPHAGRDVPASAGAALLPHTTGSLGSSVDGVLVVPRSGRAGSPLARPERRCGVTGEYAPRITPHPPDGERGGCGTDLDRPARPGPGLAGQGF